MFLKSGLGTHKYEWYGGIPALIKGAPKLVNVTVPERSIPLSKSDTQNKAWLTVSIEKMALNEFLFPILHMFMRKTPCKVSN